MEAYKPSKADYFWNMSGCLARAMASLLLVIGVTRIMGTEAGGIFSLAFSLGQLLMFRLRRLGIEPVLLPSGAGAAFREREQRLYEPDVHGDVCVLYDFVEPLSDGA